jgi:hypothetical protein
MKLTDSAVAVLRNFAGINPNLYIVPGTVLKTINDDETIFAIAELSQNDSFPIECGIYDLNEFLSIAHLVGNQDISKVDFDFQEKFVLISNGSTKVRYFYAWTKLLTYPKKNIKMPDPFVTFEISGEDLLKLKQAASIFKHPNLVFYNENSTIFAKVFNPKTEQDSSDFKLEIGSDENSQVNYRYIFNIQNLKYLTASKSFEVQFAAKGKGKIAKFESETPSISYFIGANEISTYTEVN